MKSLILISKTDIVIKIFSLVCKKLSISFDVYTNTNIDKKVDIIVVDNNFIDDEFNLLKTSCKLLGAISNEEFGFEKANDFLIPSPFLPSALEAVLQEQIVVLNKRAATKTYVTTVEQPIEEDETIVTVDDTNKQEKEAVSYIEELADNIASDINDEADDSIVTTSVVDDIDGGILDAKELSKIEDIIENNTPLYDNNVQKVFVDENQSDEDWVDLASIIDQAIDEVNSTNDLYKKVNEPIKLILNNYSLNELAPLLNLLNQDIIDSLTDGEEIILQLKLGQNNE